MHRIKGSQPAKFIAKIPNRGIQVLRPKSKADQEQELRNKLYLEIESKTKACSNSSYACSIPRLENYAYCIRHILLDPRAPYKQCAYIYHNGKKCNLAAPKHDTKKFPGLTTFCFKHSRLLQLTKTRKNVGKLKKVETTEGLLKTLTGYLNVDKKKVYPTPSNYEEYMEEEIDVVSPNAKRFSCYTNIHDLETISLPKKNIKGILDYASDSSDDGKTKTRIISERSEFDNSDNESIDSDNEDFLKHSGIYTAQEAITISKDKLVRLQQLYFGQIDRLEYLLKEKRRNYLQALRKEKETHCNIHDQKKLTQADRVQYEKLKALNHYHKWNGNEAILYKKYKEKRSKELGTFNKPQLYPKCVFTEGGVKCGDVAVPSCRYCRKHVLEDKKQILFRACSVEKSGIVCREPVANMFDDSTCVWHINLPTLRDYSQKKYESETEDEEEETIAANNKSRRRSLKAQPKKKLDQTKLKKQLTAASTITSTATLTTTITPASTVTSTANKKAIETATTCASASKLRSIDSIKKTHVVADTNHHNYTICHDPVEDDIEILAEFNVAIESNKPSILDPIEEQIAALCGPAPKAKKEK